MSPEGRARIERLLDHLLRGAAAGPRAGGAERELLREYARRILDSVVEEEVGLRLKQGDGA